MADHQEGHHHPSPEPPPKMTQHDNDKKIRPADDRRYYGQRRTLSTIIVVFLLLAGVIALTIWLVYRPHSPKFRVANAAVYALNATSSPPSSLSTTMQFTLLARNPNRRATIVYDQLTALVSYKNQPITPPITLPPMVQDTKSTVAISPVIGGGAPVAVPPEVVNGLLLDENIGAVGLRLAVNGKLRYRAGTVLIRRSRRYSVYVRCDFIVGLRNGFVGQLPLLASPPCAVNVV